MLRSPDVAAVLAAKACRTLAYGALGVVLPVYLAGLGLSAPGLGVAVTLMLLASAVLTWAIRAPAERLGPRPVLAGLAGLTGASAALLFLVEHPALVVAAAMLGNVAVGTGETGPFLTLEHVVLARAVDPERRTAVLSAYNLVGYAAAAAGAAIVGLADDPRWAFAVFAGASPIQAVAYARLSAGGPPRPRIAHGARPSGPVVRRLAALFALDAFAGGFVLQSLIAYYLHTRFAVELGTLGLVFAGTQVLTAGSLLLAAPCAARFGLLATMVGSHLVSNVLLVAIAAAPTAALAIGLLLGRHLLSQIDVPTRQAYLMAVVPDREREAAAAATNLARTLAQAATPALTGWIMQGAALAAPFALGGGLKMLYDVLLYLAFRRVPLRRE